MFTNHNSQWALQGLLNVDPFRLWLTRQVIETKPSAIEFQTQTRSMSTNRGMDTFHGDSPHESHIARSHQPANARSIIGTCEGKTRIYVHLNTTANGSTAATEKKSSLPYSPRSPRVPCTNLRGKLTTLTSNIQPTRRNPTDLRKPQGRNRQQQPKGRVYIFLRRFVLYFS